MIPYHFLFFIFTVSHSNRVVSGPSRQPINNTEISKNNNYTVDTNSNNNNNNNNSNNDSKKEMRARSQGKKRKNAI